MRGRVGHVDAGGGGEHDDDEEKWPSHVNKKRAR